MDDKTPLHTLVEAVEDIHTDFQQAHDRYVGIRSEYREATEAREQAKRLRRDAIERLEQVLKRIKRAN